MSDTYWYLAGPMSGIPQFNIPAFDYVAMKLREMGYRIVSPAETDDPETRAASLASPDGDFNSVPEKWGALLGRDIQIVSDDDCKGVIVLDGWLGSNGARLECFCAIQLGKPIHKFSFAEDHNSWSLNKIHNPLQGITAAVDLSPYTVPYA